MLIEQGSCLKRRQYWKELWVLILEVTTQMMNFLLDISYPSSELKLVVLYLFSLMICLYLVFGLKQQNAKVHPLPSFLKNVEHHVLIVDVGISILFPVLGYFSFRCSRRSVSFFTFPNLFLDSSFDLSLWSSGIQKCSVGAVEPLVNRVTQRGYLFLFLAF